MTDSLIVDTRFQSFYKCFIIDILNSDTSKYQDYRVVRIKNLYVHKVCITGMISAIYELPKMFRCKLDDSTGKINVTIWKQNNIYTPVDVTVAAPLAAAARSTVAHDANSNDTIFGDEDMTLTEIALNQHKIQALLNSIRSRTNDANINSSIIDRPKQGDLVTIKGYVKPYRNIFEICTVSCTRVRNSSEEHASMLLPVILHDKCYSLSAPIKDALEKLQLQQQNANNDAEGNNKENIIDEKFLTLVHTRLVQLTATRQPCSSFSLFNSLRRHDEHKQLTHKNVIDALKQLEIKCMIYSCDNDNTYLPMN